MSEHFTKEEKDEIAGKLTVMVKAVCNPDYRVEWTFQGPWVICNTRNTIVGDMFQELIHILRFLMNTDPTLISDPNMIALNRKLPTKYRLFDAFMVGDVVSVDADMCWVNNVSPDWNYRVVGTGLGDGRLLRLEAMSEIKVQITIADHLVEKINS